jgi:hypothetical protein
MTMAAPAAARYDRAIVAEAPGGVDSAAGSLPCPLFPQACSVGSMQTGPCCHFARSLPATMRTPYR